MEIRFKARTKIGRDAERWPDTMGMVQIKKNTDRYALDSKKK